MKRYAVGIFFFLLFILVKAGAEVILPNTLIYEKPGKLPIYKMSESIEFSPPTYELFGQDRWLKVRFLAAVKKDEKPGDYSHLSPSSKLLHPRFSTEIGSVLNEVEAFRSPLYNEDFDKTTIIEVLGYIERGSIQGGIFLEESLATIVPVLLNSEKLKNHLDNYRYQQWISDGRFLSFAVEGDGVRDPSPRPRVILFFFQKKLIAISHQREFKFREYTMAAGVRGEFLSILDNLDTDTENDFRRYYTELMKRID